MGDIRKIPLVVGLAVQRDLPDEYAQLLSQKVAAQLFALKKTYKSTEIIVLSTLARGMASLCARAALSAGCTLRGALPMEAERYMDEFPEGEAREEYRSLLSSCESSFTVPEYAVPTPVALRNVFGKVSYAVPAAHYHEQAAIYIAKHCHLLLACWDGKKRPDEERAHDFTLETVLLGYTQPFSKMAGGGTAQNSGNVLLYTAPPIHSPRPPAPQLRIRLYSGGIERKIGRRGVRLKEFSYIDRFNRDCAKSAATLSAGLARAKAVYLPPKSEEQLSASEANLLCLLAQADMLASRFQKLYTIFIYALSLAVLCIATFALIASQAIPQLLLAVYALLAALCVLAFNFAGRKRYCRRAVRYRLLSQFLSVQFYMELSGIRDYFFTVPRWVRSAEISFAERAAATQRKTDWSAPLPRNLEVVYQQWVAGEYFHYRYEAQEKQKTARVLQRLAAFSLIASVVLFFAADITALLSRDNVGLQALPASGIVTRCLLCCIAAIVLFAIYKTGLLFTDERLRFSVKMYRSLGAAKKRLLTARKSYNRRVVLSLLLLLADTQVTEALAWHSYFSPRTKYRSAKRRSIPKKKFRIPYYMRKQKRETLT